MARALKVDSRQWLRTAGERAVHHEVEITESSHLKMKYGDLVGTMASNVYFYNGDGDLVKIEFNMSRDIIVSKEMTRLIEDPISFYENLPLFQKFGELVFDLMVHVDLLFRHLNRIITPHPEVEIILYNNRVKLFYYKLRNNYGFWYLIPLGVGPVVRSWAEEVDIKIAAIEAGTEYD